MIPTQKREVNLHLFAPGSLALVTTACKVYYNSDIIICNEWKSYELTEKHSFFLSQIKIYGWATPSVTRSSLGVEKYAINTLLPCLMGSMDMDTTFIENDAVVFETITNR